MGDTNLISVTPIPKDILKEQNKLEQEGKEEQRRVILFFSFDIVNSTAYKTMTENWPLVIKELLKTIQKGVIQSDVLKYSTLWRVIGDEVVFTLFVGSKELIHSAVESIFSLLQKITMTIRYGKFFDTLSSQCINAAQVELLKKQKILSVKAAAWLAAVSEEGVCSDCDNMKVHYKADERNKFILDYLGKDIDTGFRLKALAQDCRLIVNFELAKILYEVSARQNMKNALYIMGYEKLKGVWNGNLYPIIWYYNESIATQYYKEAGGKEISFEKSFRYDEYENNVYIKAYLFRKQNLKGEDNIEYPFCHSPINMYDIKIALKKIEEDQGLKDKFTKLDSMLKDDDSLFLNKENSESSLELHCAVVCYDCNSKSIMVLKRNEDHRSNCNAWEFGCAKVMGFKSIKEEVKSYYKEHYNVEIDFVMNTEREECQPHPFAIYEVKGAFNKKGIIFFAKVHKPTQEFRPDTSHSEIKWIKESDIDIWLKKEVTIPDFKSTLKQAFSYFAEHETVFKEET